MPSISDYNTLLGKYNDLQIQLQNAEISLARVTTSGTALFQDPNYALLFNATYTTWLNSAKNSINSFTGSFPPQPKV